VILDRQLSTLEKEMVPWEPICREQVQFRPERRHFKAFAFWRATEHVATVNYRLSAGILQEKSPLPRMWRAEIEGRDHEFFQDSFAYAHKAFGTITEKNLLEEIPAPSATGRDKACLAVFLIGHGRDEYGQLVVYLRMNGIFLGQPALERSRG